MEKPHKAAPLELMHSKLMERFHEFRISKVGKETTIEINGSDLSRIIAKAKKDTYEEYPELRRKEPVLIIGHDDPGFSTEDLREMLQKLDAMNIPATITAKDADEFIQIVTESHVNDFMPIHPLAPETLRVEVLHPPEPKRKGHQRPYKFHK